MPKTHEKFVTEVNSKILAAFAGYADLIEEAAALWESISQNRAFIDGNKRTAFAVMYPFDELVPWLRNHVKREKPEN